LLARAVMCDLKTNLTIPSSVFELARFSAITACRTCSLGLYPSSFTLITALQKASPSRLLAPSVL
jgi:hypothetical protein